MYKIVRATAAATVALSLAGWTVASRAQQDPLPDGAAAKAGEKLDELGRAIPKRSCRRRRHCP